MSPAAGRSLTAIALDQEHRDQHGTPAPPEALYEAGFREGEISMLSQVLHCKSFESHKTEPVPAWFLDWVEHLRENRKKFNDKK